jgi:hypothetical protein
LTKQEHPVALNTGFLLRGHHDMMPQASCSSAGTKGNLTVEELTLQNGKWSVSRDDIRIGEKKVRID